MTGNVVHIVGTGTIGEPLIGMLADLKGELGVDEVTFSKRTASLNDRPKVLSLTKRGAILAAEKSNWQTFRELGMEPTYDYEEAIARASVVIDCTPDGSGLTNKKKFYEPHARDVKGFLAQGSEFGFGKPYAYGVNDKAVQKNDQFIQIVSCNTHNIAVILKTLAFDDSSSHLREGKFLCIRRASDVSDSKGFVPSLQTSKHEDPWGTHHARDAFYLFRTLGVDLNLFSSALKMNSQYMHCIWFDLLLNNPITLDNALQSIQANPRIAVTYKEMSSLVFSFGRDHGRFGRILNQTVMVLPSLHMRNGNELLGFCFTPQDGNTLLSSVAATERILYPEAYQERLRPLESMLFKEI
jgi:glyceraldehyde-3-phosphate dehydrogenase/erythrose-4-phosphate dehydrogenase